LIAFQCFPFYFTHHCSRITIHDIRSLPAFALLPFCFIHHCLPFTIHSSRFTVFIAFQRLFFCLTHYGLRVTVHGLSRFTIHSSQLPIFFVCQLNSLPDCFQRRLKPAATMFSPMTDTYYAPRSLLYVKCVDLTPFVSPFFSLG